MQTDNQKLLFDLVEKSKDFLSSLTYQKISNGETLAYRHVKTLNQNFSRTIVLIHGNLQSSDGYDTLSVVLQPYFNVYAVDLRMFGDSTYNNPITKVEDWVDDLKLFFDSVGLKKFTLAGLSLGGAIIQAFAAKYQEYVENLVCISSVSPAGLPAYKVDDQSNPTQNKVESLEEFQDLPQWKPALEILNQKNYMGLKGVFEFLCYSNNMKPEPEERFINLCKTGLKQKSFALAMFLLNKFNLTSEKNQFGNGNGEIEKITCPVLVLHGSKDIIVPVSAGEEIVKYIGENAQLQMIENAGHVFILESYDYLIKAKDLILSFCKINK